MRITGSVSGDLGGMADELIADITAGARAAVQIAASSMQSELRGQTRAANLGDGLEKAWGVKSFANRGGGPASLVYSKSREIFSAFNEGVTITSGRGRFLVIPTDEAKRLGFANSNTTRAGGGTGSIPRRVAMVDKAARELGRKNLKLLPTKKGGGYVLVYQLKRNQKPVVLFIYRPMVRLQRRLDFDGAVSRAEARLGAELERMWGGS